MSTEVNMRNLFSLIFFMCATASVGFAVHPVHGRSGNNGPGRGYALDGPYTLLGPEGGIVYSLAGTPENPGLVFAGTGYGGGIYKSTDGGNSWRSSSQGLLDDSDLSDFYPSVRCLVIDPRDFLRIYAGTDAGVFRSTDGGERWVEVVHYGRIGSIAINPLETSVLYAGSELVEKSTDGGDTWTTMSDGLPASEVNELLVSADDTAHVFAGTDSSLYESLNGGALWARVEGGFPADGVLALESVPGDSGVYYAGCIDSGVYMSTDGGGSWTAMNNGLQDTSGLVPQVNALAIDPTQTAVIYAGTHEAGVFISSNGGEDWRAFNEGLVSNLGRLPFLHDLVIAGEGSESVLAATGGFLNGAEGIFSRRNETLPWQRSNTGLTNTVPLDISFHPYMPDRFLLATRESGVFVTTDGGSTWISSNSGLDTPVINTIDVDPVNPDRIFAGTGGLMRGSGVYRSTDAGENWHPSHTGIDTMSIYALVIDPVDPATLIAGGHFTGIARSTNSGGQWTITTAGIEGSILELAIDPTDHLRMYAGGHSGRVYRSSDGGVSWEPCHSGIPEGLIVTSIVSAGHEPGLLYLTGENWPLAPTVYKSTDAGDSWVAIGEDLQDPFGYLQSHDIALDPTDGTVLFVGLENHPDPIFRSPDGGIHWKPYATDLALPGLAVFLEFDPFDETKLYTSMYAFGLVLIDVSQVGTGDQGEGGSGGLPRAVSLAQNFPNPFNPATVIPFEIPETAGPRRLVTLAVYDLRGKLVRVLLEREYEPGRYEATWNGTNAAGEPVSSGIYLYMLRSGDETLTRKMLLRK
jgi:photosystem II stability/assembly factor-like uncharacterized protein